jgi:hypothetical protein
MHGDRAGGAVTMYVLAALVGLVAMAALVLDGGRFLAAREHAATVAAQAARAGAASLSPASLRSGAGPSGGVGLSANPGRASRAAQRVLHTGGVTGSVTVTNGRVRVHAVVHKPTVMLAIVGVDELTGGATEAARPLHGTTHAGGGD